MLVLEERGKPEYPEKTSRNRVENQQTQPTYDAEPGNQTQATLVGGKCSDTVPTLLPFKLSYYFIIIFIENFTANDSLANSANV